MVKSMLAFGADPSFHGSYPDTPLEVAVYAQDNSIAYELLKNGAHLTEIAVSGACMKGSLELMKLFIPLPADSGISLNYTKLLVVVLGSRTRPLPVIDFLLSQGADINGEGPSGDTPLLRAIQGYEPATMVPFLINKGASVTQEALSAACACGNLELVKLLMPLVEQGITDLGYYTKLLVLAGPQSLSLVKFLLEKGADINCKNKTGNSLLFRALYVSRLKESSSSTIAKYLIEKGAALTPSTEGESLLSVTIQKGRADLTELLIQHGADLTPNVLLAIVTSKKFSSTEKIQLTKSILGKNCPLSTDILEVVKENATEDKNDDEEDRLEKKQWAQLIPLLEQAYTQQ
jgi:ankyrin repeat protein